MTNTEKSTFRVEFIAADGPHSFTVDQPADSREHAARLVHEAYGHLAREPRYQVTTDDYEGSVADAIITVNR